MNKEINKKFKEIEERVGKIESTLSKSSLSKPGKLVECVKCGYLWRTQSKAIVVSCPNCNNKTPVKKKDLYVKGKSWAEQIKKI